MVEREGGAEVEGLRVVGDGEGEVAAKAAKPGKLDVAATVARLCSGKASWDEQQALWSKLTPEQQDELLRAMEATARARSHSPESRLWQALWVATREVEQAVWMLMLGPVRLKR